MNDEVMIGSSGCLATSDFCGEFKAAFCTSSFDIACSIFNLQINLLAGRVWETRLSMHERGETQRRRLIYSGRVQGVGFRYTIVSIARRFPVTGYVRNLSDGSVELAAEGSADVLDEFLRTVASTFERNIQDCRPLEDSAGETYSRFEIRR